MDARQRKTHAALTSAVLEMAEERPVTELTVSEVATRARVHRSTFYQHATSPAELLQTALRDELDRVRDRYLPDGGPADVAAAVTAVTEAVLRHVDDHAAIYSRGLGEGSGSASLHSMLSAHFRQSVRLLLQQSVTIPSELDGVSGDILRDAAAAYIADGTVGAIEVWLRLPAPRSAATFLGLLSRLLPSWWPLRGGEAPTPGGPQDKISG